MSDDVEKINEELLEALIAAEEHLSYCGYGDSWERECAEASNLPTKIGTAIKNATNVKSKAKEV